MQTQQTPQVLQQPFAAQGDKNTIPNAATGTNKASLQEGFPPITGQPINQGGIPPERQDFNGAMNLNSQFYFAFQNGWWPTFTQEVSDAIGGYPQGAVLWLFDTENNVYTPLLSLVGNNTYNFNTNKDYIGQYWAKILPDSGRGLPLGAIYFSSSSNADDNPGALPLWSGAYYTNASTLYPAFYAWVKSHTELCKSKTEYDAAVSTYGECPYYVVDEVAGSLRLPKLVNYLKMANATDGITQAQAGVPNITGILKNCQMDSTNATGAFKSTGSDNYGGSNSGFPRGSIDFSATRSSAVYGRSSTVTPAHTTVFPWVVSTASDAESSAAAAAQSADAAATSAINASNSASAAAQSAQEAADSAASVDPGNLAKVDLSNVSQLPQSRINAIMPANMDYVVESYTDAETGQWYRVYKSGWIEQGGFVSWNESFITKTFLKPFANLPYYASLVPGERDKTFTQWGMTLFVDIVTPTTMNLVARNGNNVLVGSTGYWYACGQGA